MSESALARPRPSFRRAFLWMAACSLFFVVLYNASNWITTQRSDVGTWFYAWELKIPFIPWMIVPYWSLDAFFVGSFFFCQSPAELDTLGRRLGLATLVATLCFLLIPLTTAFPRPRVEGVFGLMFDSLRAFDQPHNLFPSLHITLRTILAVHYGRHTRGPLRWASHAWFSLIGFSTLFTYQHHVVDVLGGFGLAAICFHVFREELSPAPRLTRSTGNPAVAARYGLGFALCLVIAWCLRPWGMWMLWPAYGLGATALAYLGLGGAIYAKTDGRLPLSARLLLAPVRFGHWLSWMHYKRQCRIWDEAYPGVFIGRRISDRDRKVLDEAGFSAVLDLTAESSEHPELLKRHYLNLPVLDLTAPSPAQLEAGAAFIQHHQTGGKVYVHCKIGYSRSAALVAAYALLEGLAQTTEEACQHLRAIRPSVVIRPEIHQALLEFEKGLKPLS